MYNSREVQKVCLLLRKQGQLLNADTSRWLVQWRATTSKMQGEYSKFKSHLRGFCQKYSFATPTLGTSLFCLYVAFARRYTSSPLRLSVGSGSTWLVNRVKWMLV